MGKSKYTEVCEEISEKIKASVKPSGKIPVSTSNTDLVRMTQALLNSPEHEVVEYNPRLTDESGNAVSTTKQPAKRYRESLKPMLKSAGVDKNEIDKVIEEYQFNKESAAALMDLAIIVEHDYVKSPRKLPFPITSKDEAQMSISTVSVAEKITETKKFDKDANGVSISVPTVKTHPHTNIKVTNKVPWWLKTEI
jgi:hypothetical protein